MLIVTAFQRQSAFENLKEKGVYIMTGIIIAVVAAVLVMCLALDAYGGDVSGEVSESDASVSSAVTADNPGTSIIDEQIKTLAEAYNQIAPLYNEVYVAAEANG